MDHVRGHVEKGGDAVHLGALLVLGAMCVDDDVPAMDRHGQIRVSGQEVGQGAEPGDERGADGGIGRVRGSTSQSLSIGSGPVSSVVS
jgi:hypothetical protein